MILRPSIRIMTVCTGNICRSPMAEIVLQERFARAGLAECVAVDSTGVSNEEAGNPIDPRAARALVARGYGADGTHRARQVRPEQLGRRDLVLAMTAQHARMLRRMAAQVLADPAAGAGSGSRLDRGAEPVAAVEDRIRMYRSFDSRAAGATEGEEYLLDVADPWYGGAGDFEICLDEIEAAADGIVADVAHRLG